MPVPGIIRAAGMPASTNASSSASFSATVSELPSELVPNTASPTSLARSHRQWRDEPRRIGTQVGRERA